MLGVFLPNSSWAFWPSTAATGTEWTYEYNRELVRLAEHAGFSFAFPAGRWKGIEGDVINSRGVSLDTLTLATGLLEATERITILATVHTNVFNPVVAAKMCADIDQIAQGRFGLNIVSGWHADEFASMSIPLLDHKERYNYTREWLDIIETLWDAGSCSYEGRFLKVDDAVCRPRPAQHPRPLIVNAGQSYTGMRFAAEEADYLFSHARNAKKFRAITEDAGRDVGFIATRKIIVRPSQAQAEELADTIVEQADLGLIRAEMVINGSASAEEAQVRVADPGNVRAAVLQDAVIGSPDHVAAELADWIIDTGADGISFTFFDYLRDLEFFDGHVKQQLGERLAAAGRNLIVEGCGETS